MTDHTAPQGRKTRADVEALKSDWRRDPCYDLVDDNGTVEGFEDYADELQAFQEAWWAEAEQKERARVSDRCRKLDVSRNALAYIESLERRIEALESVVSP